MRRFIAAFISICFVSWHYLELQTLVTSGQSMKR